MLAVFALRALPAVTRWVLVISEVTGSLTNTTSPCERIDTGLPAPWHTFLPACNTSVPTCIPGPFQPVISSYLYCTKSRTFSSYLLNFHPISSHSHLENSKGKTSVGGHMLPVRETAALVGSELLQDGCLAASPILP